MRRNRTNLKSIYVKKNILIVIAIIIIGVVVYKAVSKGGNDGKRNSGGGHDGHENEGLGHPNVK